MKLAVLALLALPSCASVMARPTAVTVTSNPPGVPFRTSQGQYGTTPTVIQPPRQDQDLRVTFEVGNGRLWSDIIEARQSQWIWGNVLLGPVGMVGIVVDWTNPKIWVLERDHVHWEAPQG